MRSGRTGRDMQRLLFATDFSERSDRALRRAVLLARQSGASLEIVHVIDDDRPRRIVEQEATEARHLVDGLARSLREADGLVCETRIVLADPFAGIVQTVKSTKPDLLIIGPHRRQLLRDIFVGTTAERTIRSAGCPVLMVNGPPVGPYRHILMTTDLSDASRNALDRFAALDFGQLPALSLLHVYGAPALRLAMSDTMVDEDRDAYLREVRGEVQAELGALAAQLAGPRAQLILRHDETSVAHEILRAADDLEADLVVVSTQGRNALTRILLGSVTDEVLTAAPVDVLAIPPVRAD